ncbi:hypothetical protein HD597_005298 [Nonomuraea thailandensis]|uniref:Uncharacterized protein n=1 Tax=Nonomuraea thailandensis TaxID=1188745 RepID=A0A9X2GP70_9ACTN|nr:hypothetical protein [Nonomuraea thailandensis]MCP2358278.1 hypothetical protein [Nonomuraea thailandensis]
MKTGSKSRHRRPGGPGSGARGDRGRQARPEQAGVHLVERQAQRPRATLSAPSVEARISGTRRQVRPSSRASWSRMRSADREKPPPRTTGPGVSTRAAVPAARSRV